jgi:hypothetical protein
VTDCFVRLWFFVRINVTGLMDIPSIYDLIDNILRVRCLYVIAAII